MNVQIHSPCGNLSDHEAVVGWLRSGSSLMHKRYLNASRSKPWKLPTEPADVDILMACLQENRQAAPSNYRARKPWIRDETWRLVDQRAELKRSNGSPEVLTAMNNRIHRALRSDRKQCVIDAGNDIEAALEWDNLQEAWNIAKGWYKTVSRKAPKPSRQDFNELHQERTALYSTEPSPGDPIPVRLNAPFPINDAPPHRGRSRGRMS